MTSETVTTEWGLVLEGDLGKSIGDRFEMDDLTEDVARRRLEKWAALRPDVKATLRQRERRTVVGDWSEVQA